MQQLDIKLKVVVDNKIIKEIKYHMDVNIIKYLHYWDIEIYISIIESCYIIFKFYDNIIWAWDHEK